MCIVSQGVTSLYTSLLMLILGRWFQNSWLEPQWKEHGMQRFHIALGACLLVPLAARAGVILSVEAPAVQTSQVSGVVTEDFDSFATGNYLSLPTAVGNFTA